MSCKASWAVKTKKGICLLMGPSRMCCPTEMHLLGRGVSPAQASMELILMELWLEQAEVDPCISVGLCISLMFYHCLKLRDPGMSAWSLQRLKIWIWLVQCLTSISLLSSNLMFEYFYINLYPFRNILHHLKAVNFLSSVWIWLFERH